MIIHLRQFLTDEALGLIEVDPEDARVRDRSRRGTRTASSSTWRPTTARSTTSRATWCSRAGCVSTGNETVLDAINYAGGLLPTAAPQNIRLVRPAPPGACCAQVLPVNLAAIVNAGDTTTNYQLMPGDRIVVYRDPIVRTSVFLNRIGRAVLHGRSTASSTTRSPPASLQFLNRGITTGTGTTTGTSTTTVNPNILNPAASRVR